MRNRFPCISSRLTLRIYFLSISWAACLGSSTYPSHGAQEEADHVALESEHLLGLCGILSSSELNHRSQRVGSACSVTALRQVLGSSRKSVPEEKPSHGQTALPMRRSRASHAKAPGKIHRHLPPHLGGNPGGAAHMHPRPLCNSRPPHFGAGSRACVYFAHDGELLPNEKKMCVRLRLNKIFKFAFTYCISRLCL